MTISNIQTNYYDIHIFCCTNRREAGNARGSCAAQGSEALRDYLKKRVPKDFPKKVRVNTAGCLDRCELGPVLVIYPEGVWYHYENENDVEEIFEQHIAGGQLVERLLLKPQQKRL